MNPFDQFDAAPSSNPFDQFDSAKEVKPRPKVDTTPLSMTEEALANIRIPKWMQSVASTARSFVQGAADPVVGAVQLGANLVGQGDTVNKAVQENEAKQSSLKFNENGWDTAARVAGNVASPVNLVAASQLSRIPMATTGQMVKAGAGLGAIGGATQPVTSGDYWPQKALDVGLGAVTGGVLTPILGKVGEAVIRRIGNNPVDDAVLDANIQDVMTKAGIDIRGIPDDQLNLLRAQVGASLERGKAVDPAALAREADFRTSGINPTLGQLTREPMQFAREQNLRGVAGVGEPLTARLAEQQALLQNRIAGRASGAIDPLEAGGRISQGLANVDDLLSREVSAKYGAARQAAGKDLDVPLTGLAQDYAQIVSDFADRIPPAIRGKFAELGLDPSVAQNQRKIFTVEDADKLLKAINKNQSNDPAVNRALSELRGAVKKAVTEAAPDGGVFAPAVAAAAERFKMHEAIPALKAAAEGVEPDDFVRKLVIGDKAANVKGLADVLKKADREAFEVARGQIADALMKQAYGASMTGRGDAIGAASYSKFLQQPGMKQKLEAFFSPQEVQDIYREARVANYILRAPATSAVNRSNTASAAANLLTRVPGYGPAAAVANKAFGAVADKNAVNRALEASLPVTGAPLDPMKRNQLARLLALSGLAAGQQ